MNELLPSLLVIVPLAGAVLTLLLLRWPRVVAGVGTAVVAGLWFALQLSAGDEATSTLLGQPLLLTESFRTLLIFVYGGMGLLFAATIWLPQGNYFVPASLFALAPLAMTDMLQSTALGSLALLTAVVGLTVTIQGETAGEAKPALRYLLMFVVAVPFFVVADWFAGHHQPFLAGRLFLFGVLVLSAGFPFYIWVRPLVITAVPLVLPLVFGLVQSIIVYFFLAFLQTNGTFQSDAPFLGVVYWSGIATLIIALLMVVLASTWPQLWAGSLLMDMGLALFALVIGTGETAVTLTMARFTALFVGGLGFALLKQYGIIQHSFTELSGKGYQSPFVWGLVGYGFLSLLGMPLTASFEGRWLVVTAVAQTAFPSILPSLLLLCAILFVVCMILWRLSRLWLNHSDDVVPVEPLFVRWLSVGVIGICVLTAVVPLL